MYFLELIFFRWQRENDIYLIFLKDEYDKQVKLAERRGYDSKLARRDRKSWSMILKLLDKNKKLQCAVAVGQLVGNDNAQSI